MYSNQGGKLITAAIVVMVIGLVVSILGGFWLFFLASEYRNVLFGVLAIPFLGVGLLWTYVVSLVFSALGELVEKSTKCEQYLSEIYKNMGGSVADSTEGTGFVKVCTACGTKNDALSYTCKNCGMGLPEAKPKPASAGKAGGSSSAKPAGTGFVKVCTICGKENDAMSFICKNCGMGLPQATPESASAGKAGGLS